MSGRTRKTLRLKGIHKKEEEIKENIREGERRYRGENTSSVKFNHH